MCTGIEVEAFINSGEISLSDEIRVVIDEVFDLFSGLIGIASLSKSYGVVRKHNSWITASAKRINNITLPMPFIYRIIASTGFRSKNNPTKTSSLIKTSFLYKEEHRDQYETKLIY